MDSRINLQLYPSQHSIAPEPAAHRKQTISLIVPCYNEAEAFPFLQKGLTDLANRLATEFDIEIILVDDGSRDATWQRIIELSSLDDRVLGIQLSRNFGHQASLTCGYQAASGDAIVCMDADLQDPPEVILEMVDKWQEGADVVYSVRESREGETKFKLLTAHLFYRLIRLLGANYIQKDSGDFRLLSRRSLNALLAMPEQHRFIRGMVGWIGFSTAEVRYQRKARVAGITKYPTAKMLRLSTDAIVSFSLAPLRLAFYSAFALAAFFMTFFAYVQTMHFAGGEAITQGWPSLFLAVIGFGFANLISLAILGEYVGRIHEQSKQRPLYLIQEVVSQHHDQTNDLKREAA